MNTRMEPPPLSFSQGSYNTIHKESDIENELYAGLKSISEVRTRGVHNSDTNGQMTFCFKIFLS